MNKIMSAIKSQGSEYMICDQEFYEMEPPAKAADQYREEVQSI